MKHFGKIPEIKTNTKVDKLKVGWLRFLLNYLQANNVRRNKLRIERDDDKKMVKK